MKTKQVKEELEKSPDDEPVKEPKTRGRKKASDLNEEEKSKIQNDPRTSKEPRRNTKPKAIVKKRPLGIKKTKILRNKKVTVGRKRAVRQTVTRTRKANKETDNSQDKETIPLIPAAEIKKEPVDELNTNSRSSSPKSTGRRVRLSSDMVMMKSVLGDSPSSLVLGPRTSPYSMRSERSNSPSLFDGKNLRSGKPRKVKSNLLNEVVMKEQKKRRRLLSDPKPADAPEALEDGKKLKRGRSRSRDGSEISKCSDITESDASLSETINDSEKELSKNLDKTKTDLDIDNENIVQISPIGNVPSLSVDSKLSDTKPDSEPSSIFKEKDKKKLSLKRSTSLDSDNNNSNRIKLENINVEELEEKYLLKTDALFQERSKILSSMSKTFNSKEVSKNIRKARRGKKAATTSRPAPNQSKNGMSSTITNDLDEIKIETVDSLSKEISDLINDLDQNIDQDQQIVNESNNSSTDQLQTKPARQFYGLSKPLGDNNSIITPETPVKEKDTILEINNEFTPSKNDDSENIRLHYSDEKCSDTRQEITYKPSTVASIDKLMDRLKEFEEFDKKRQRQESESKSNDSKSVMVTNDVVLIPKSGADIKPLKDLQPVRSPEKLIEKENVLSCFENNSAISIVKRDQVRRSLDVDLPNSVTLIKRNSVSARKESTSSTHSREADAISIFEKSLGKDVTLTEIRKSVEKAAPVQHVDIHQIDIHQFATLHPNTSNQALVSAVSALDSNQISITPRNMEAKLSNEVQITKRKSSGSQSRKPSESGLDAEEKMATIDKIKSPPPPQIKSPVAIAPTPVAIKSPEPIQPMEAEALAPIEPMESNKIIPDDIALTSEVPRLESVLEDSAKIESVVPESTLGVLTEKTDIIETVAPVINQENKVEADKEKTEEMETVTEETIEEPMKEEAALTKSEERREERQEAKVEEPKPKVANVKLNKSARNSIENLPGPSSVLPSNILLETPESQKRKENVLRTLGLLTHKEANEAKIEKLREKERIYGSNYCGVMKGKSGRSDYTGTLKTVIKLNRGVGERDKKKYRSSLKMTFQKSKGRSGRPQLEVGDTRPEEEFYTIGGRESTATATGDGGHRKSHYSNRLNHVDGEVPPEPEPKETLNLVIPEKASSFSIHPGRLCMDQCFYCGGKFGLFDTPCHIAQMKSSERQRKVLDNEEKLTIDSCLCDACYRHVDRRANCPSYRKRPVAKPPDVPQLPEPTRGAVVPEKQLSPPLEEESEEEAAAAASQAGRPASCHTAGCVALGDHAIRRKWLIKMRAGVNKLLQLKCDYPGLHTIPLCGEHYRVLAPLMCCVLCRRRLTKHHNLHFINHDWTDYNPLFKQAGIPVEFTERPVLCKVCRYFCTLLQRPGLNDGHAEAYTRKLLQIYKVEIPPELRQHTDDAEVLEDCNTSASKQKKKARAKVKQRKSTEPEKDSLSSPPSSERTTESSPEKEKSKEELGNEESEKQNVEEDIESLISSNRILVPNAKSTESNPQSDTSETDMIADLETPLIPIDKQTELQYLLQRQNNPAQFKTSLTQKQKNILKVHNLGIQKAGLQQRIMDKNAKKIHKIGQIITQKDNGKPKKDEFEFEIEKPKEIVLYKNINLNDECTIETIPNKKSADINTLKNKWQMSESFTQVKKNISELSKKLTVEKDPKKPTDSKYSNPVKRLETNPSISVRELFPGEEEMNLQCNIEFNNVKGVTPEGWEKCNTTIQYDPETKKLWNELQRPYGNQSSFIRHLILLEKYFRRGDLVLSHNASPHAANYSSSVHSRLRAYDNVPPEPRREPVSLIEFRKKPSVNGKSLLKSNQTEEKDPKKFMPPPVLPKHKKSEKKTKALPPELIAINTPNAQGRKAIQNVLHNIQQLVKGVSASDPTEVAISPLPPKIDVKEKKEMPGLKFDPPREKKEKKETPKKVKTNSKGWRPNLMPITQENLAKVAREPLKLAVDGHSLPSLVQVLSGGTRYHITFEDYNKMCLIRKERQQKLQENKETKNLSEETIITEVQTSSMLGNGGTVVQNIPPEEKKDMPELIGSNAATILKNVGLKNITIAPIPSKTATITSQSTTITTPLLVSNMKLPQLGPAVSITTETMTHMTSPIVMPKIPKSLTVIPQTAVTTMVTPVLSDQRP